jgi:hypothetical protein
MKRFWKILIIAVMAAMLAAICFAAGQLVSINVDPSIKILVNGQEFHPKDVKGNDVMTFTYNGTTYCPLRALAEAYGLEVGYDSNLKMATVSQPGTKSNDNASASGIRGEIKEAIDSYEAFIDEYCEFMKNYNSSDVSMLTKYASMLQKYSDYTKKMDEIKSKDLTAEELNYYTQVSLRCLQKIAAIQ